MLQKMPLPTVKSMVNSHGFTKLCRQAFDELDTDHNDKLDCSELYIPLLLVYDKINSRLSVHIEPPSKADVDSYIKCFDLDANHTLEFQEFVRLCQNVFGVGKRGLRDSLLVRMGFAVLANMVIWPVAGTGLKWVLVRLGYTEAGQLPSAVLSHAVKGACQFLSCAFV